MSYSRVEDPYFLDRSRESFSQSGLRNIEEDHPMSNITLGTYTQPPDTPQEPMEFLARSWSISAIDVHRALTPVATQAYEPRKIYGVADLQPETQLETAPFTFASSVTSQLVMDRILNNGPQDQSPYASRRNSHSSGPLSFVSPPVSPRGSDVSSLTSPHLMQYRRQSFSLVPRGKSMGRWIKEMKEKKKELNRTRKAQVHAAVTVAGVAAAIAAVAAATAASSTDEQSTRTAMAMASAAALVAAQCVEVAESLGADREQMAAVVSSAVSVKSAGDILTLTASAATALRGAATLRQRTMKDARNVATVMPYERSIACQSSLGYGSDYGIDEDSELEYSTHEILSRGAEFLKRSKNGEVQWRNVFVYLNKQGQVVLRLQSKIMAGALKKNKKSLILHVYPDIPAWPGRQLLDNGDQRRYFALKTSKGDVEFECKTAHEHRIWTEGINRLLCLSRRYCQR